jgi:putative transposase
VSPARRRRCVEPVKERLGVSERLACRVLGQHGSTQQKGPRTADEEAMLTAGIVELARRSGRHGYRRITALLREAGWTTNPKRVERIWRRDGLKGPRRQPRRGRLWRADGACIRRRPERPRHVWAYDCVADRTRDGRRFRMLCVVDEFTREALALRVGRKLTSAEVIDTLADLCIARGVPAHLRSDQGPGFIAEAVKDWISAVGSRTADIERGSPWENGSAERFNARLRDALLDGEVFNTLAEARVLIEAWPKHDTAVRPHPAPGYRPPAPEVLGLQPLPASPMTRAHAVTGPHWTRPTLYLSVACWP